MPAFGWIKNSLDPRDYRVNQIIPEMRIIPMVKYNLHGPILDQKDLGSCVMFAFTSLMQDEEIRRGDELLEFFSQRFAYQHYNEVINSDPSLDEGCVPRLAIKLLQRDGVCLSETVPYDTREYGNPMPPRAYEEGLENQVLEYYTLSTESEMLSVVASDYNFAAGITVFESFMDAPKGEIPMPDIYKEKLLGGHMIKVVGYDRHARKFLCQNSWGENWGDKGMFRLDFEYFSTAYPVLASDFTVIKRIE